MRSLHKRDSFSWADMIEAAEDCVAQYPHPTEKGQNELIGWDALNYYLRLLLADDTADFPQKYERHFYSKKPEMEQTTMGKMIVLCEESQAITIAFRKKGVEEHILVM